MAEDPTQLDNALRRGKDARARFDADMYISEQDADRMALADEIDRLRAREAELLAQIESMRTGLDAALDKVRRRL